MKFIHRILSRLSTFRKSRKTPYEYLKNAPRYKEMVVQLLDQDFIIADSVSFYWNYREIFIDDIYKFNSNSDIPRIIDCGSNYGTSIVYFKQLYPDAHILGVEADPNIFNLLASNIKTRNYNDVTLLNKAVMDRTEPIKFYYEGADAGRVHYLENAKGTVQVDSIKLDDLIENQIDLLKVDIEGAETEVICTSEKLNDISHLFIEYHSLKNTEQSLARLLEKLASNGFRYYIQTQFCSDRPLIEEKLQCGMDLQLNIFAKRLS